MAGPTLFRPSDITTGLVGYWKLDEASGTRADSSPNGNDLTDNNTVTSVAQDYWKTGENSADFESGNSEYLSIADGSQTGLDMASSSVSMVAWVKRESAAAQVIQAKGVMATAGYAFTMTSGSEFELWVHDTAYTSSGAGISVGKWHHMAMVFDFANSLLSAYLDGNLVYSVAAAKTITGTADEFTIGKRSVSSASYFDGLMKDAAIWNVALTPIQIKSLALGVDLETYAYRPNNVSTQPTAWWKLNELSTGAGAVTRVDSGSNGLDLTDNTTTTSRGGYIEGVAPDFNNTDGYLSHADDALLDPATSVSFAAWVKFDTASTLEYIASKGSSWQFWRQADGTLAVWINSGTVRATTATTTNKAGTWFHVAFSHDNTGNLTQIWVDGVLELSVANTDNLTVNATDFRLGQNSTAANNMDGAMQDAAIWTDTYILTDTDVKSLACGIPVQQTGIVSYWTLDETSGTRVDSIGSNDLTDNNTVLYGTGKVSNAADFEAAASEYLSVASNSSLDITAEFTLFAWVKPESVSVQRHIYSKDATGASGYGLIQRSDNLVGIQVKNTASLATSTVSAGTWYHIGGTFTGAQKYVYFNSVLEATNASADPPATNATAVSVGATSSGAGYYDGLIDELILSIRWFRPEEIKTIYCKGLCGKELTSEEIVAGGSTGNFFLMF